LSDENKSIQLLADIIGDNWLDTRINVSLNQSDA